MGNCFCNNDPYRQYVLKSDVYVNYTMDNLNSNFTTAKLVDFDKVNSRTRTKNKNKLSSNTNETGTTSLISTEKFIRFKSKKSNGFYNENVRKMNNRENLFKEFTDRNSVAGSIKENRLVSHHSSVFDQKDDEEAIIIHEEELNNINIAIENNEEKDNIEEERVMYEMSKEEEKQLKKILLSHFMFRHESKQQIKKICT